jgi:hypothetical protein
MAGIVDAHPCPWCGGETGTFAEYAVLDTSIGKIYPAADMVSSDLRGVDEPIRIQHRADDSCC